MSFFINKKLQKIKEKVEKKSKVKRYIELGIGSLLVAISFNLFLAPNDLVPGGVSGFAIILNHLFSINKTLVITLLSIILLIPDFCRIFKNLSIFSYSL